MPLLNLGYLFLSAALPSSFVGSYNIFSLIKELEKLFHCSFEAVGLSQSTITILILLTDLPFLPFLWVLRTFIPQFLPIFTLKDKSPPAT